MKYAEYRSTVWSIVKCDLLPDWDHFLPADYTLDDEKIIKEASRDRVTPWCPARQIAKAIRRN